MLNHGTPVSCVHDKDPLRRVRGEKNHIVKDPAAVGEYEPVPRGSGAYGSNVDSCQALEKFVSRRSTETQPAHVGHIEYAAAVPNCIVFLRDTPIHDRHFESGERSHPCAECEVAVEKGCSQQGHGRSRHHVPHPKSAFTHPEQFRSS